METIKQQTEQLRVEAHVQRKKVSEVSKESVFIQFLNSRQKSWKIEKLVFLYRRL